MGRSLEKTLNVRLPAATRLAFCEKANKYSSVSLILRELIDAYIDDRLFITPLKGSLYDNRNKD